MSKQPYMEVLTNAVGLFCRTDEDRAAHVVRRLREAGFAITPHIGQHTRPMHVALDSKNRVQATWYRGCVQPYPVWLKAIRGLGYRQVKVQVTFPW